MNIHWINETSTHTRAAFVTLRCHREADGTVRLNIYFAERAAAALNLHRGERLLVGLDDTGKKLYFRPTLFGGNVIKGRAADNTLQCMVTLPLQNLPAPQLIRESDLIMTPDHIAVPFEFDVTAFAGWQRPAKLRVAA